MQGGSSHPVAPDVGLGHAVDVYARLLLRLDRDLVVLLVVVLVPALSLVLHVVGRWLGGCKGRLGCRKGRTKVAHSNDDDDDERQRRVVCSRAPSTFALGACGISLRYAYLSQRGHYPDDLEKANQDCFKIVEHFNDQPDQMLLGVFDGHGEYGDDCSRFVRDEIKGELIRQIRFDPGNFEEAYAEAFRVCNERMHEQEDFDDTSSGTTAITAFFHGPQLTIANVGDSRAIVGVRKGKRVVSISLSMDQTPYRHDEAERVRACGAEVMSYGQAEGSVPYHENWNTDLGNEIDSEGDPPRVWIPGGEATCAFTRSLGDREAEAVGVNAEPEMLHK